MRHVGQCALKLFVVQVRCGSRLEVVHVLKGGRLLFVAVCTRFPINMLNVTEDTLPHSVQLKVQVKVQSWTSRYDAK